eukprot:11549129-Ditylum_brightwellii.AAC.1
MNRFTFFCLALYLSNTAGFSAVKKAHTHSLDKFVIGTAALAKKDNPELFLDAAYERGFNTFDLARTYGGGESERIFGRWLAKHGGKGSEARQNLYIITKGGMGEDKYGDPNRRRMTLESLKKEVHESLKSLDIEIIDMYMLHRDDPRIDVGTIVDWMNILIEEGHIKAWGVSNWPLDRTMEAIEYAEENEMVPPTSNSPQFSLAVPEVPVWPTTVSLSGPEELSTIEWYKQNNIDLYCWEVLAKGFMAKPDLWCEESVDREALNRPVVIGSDDWRLQRIQKAYCTEDNYLRRSLATELAENH